MPDFLGENRFSGSFSEQSSEKLPEKRFSPPSCCAGSQLSPFYTTPRYTFLNGGRRFFLKCCGLRPQYLRKNRLYAPLRVRCYNAAHPLAAAQAVYDSFYTPPPSCCVFPRQFADYSLVQFFFAFVLRCCRKLGRVNQFFRG
jgi:hypothetical protein